MMQIFPGTYSCHVTNEVGDSECSLDVTEEILAGGVMDLVIIFIVSVIVVMIVVVIFVVLCYLCWRRGQQDPDFKGQKEMHDVVRLNISFQPTSKKKTAKVNF